MDPVTILTAATAASKAIYQVSTTLYSFIEGSLHIDSTLRALVDEVESLKTVITFIETGLRSPALADRRVSGRVDAEDHPELFTAIDYCLQKCSEQVEQFGVTLANIGGSGSGSTGNKNPFRKPLMQVRLDFNSKEIAMHRARVATHTSGLQLVVQMLNVQVFCV
jgi:hypothetical protein